MLRKLLMVPVLAGTLAFGGCATVGEGGGSVSVVDPVKIEQIRQTAAAICGFLPTVTTVANIITTFTGGAGTVDMVSQAAQGICAALTAKSVRRGGNLPKYRGVVIRGDFVR